MLIIGEKINGTRKRVRQAIAERETAFIQDLAMRQAEAGADWLDVNAGTHPDQEADDLIWLIETIQSVTSTPLCLDSANPTALKVVMPLVDAAPMINSINGEAQRLNGILPLTVDHQCDVIALAMNDRRVPASSEERMAIIHEIMETTRQYGVPDEKVFLDPLAMTIATDIQSALTALATLRAIRQEYPAARTTIGLSNISFGLPARSYVNRAFLTLALAAGLDSAIIDPLDREMLAAMYAAELVLGRDRHCLNYARAFRSGTIGQGQPMGKGGQATAQ
jgi:cobalamin-dependent methionine synthase I